MLEGTLALVSITYNFSCFWTIDVLMSGLTPSMRHEADAQRSNGQPNLLRISFGVPTCLQIAGQVVLALSDGLRYALVAVGTQELGDGGFESDGDIFDPKFWSLSGDTSKFAVFANSDNLGYSSNSGTHAARLGTTLSNGVGMLDQTFSAGTHPSCTLSLYAAFLPMMTRTSTLSLRVMVDAKLLIDASNAAQYNSSSTSSGYTKYSAQFTAIGTSQLLSFQVINQYGFFLLDDVSIICT